MTDRDSEVADLAMADRHIENGKRLLAEQQHAVDLLVHGGHDTSDALDLLRTMRLTLDQFEAHRTLILETIADIDAGRL